MKYLELLVRDHQLILRALEVMEEMIARVVVGKSVNPEDVKKVIRFLNVFEDEHHQTKEESALFPILMRVAGNRCEKLRQMHFEHDQERSLAEGLEEAVNTKSGPDFVHFAGRLVELLRNHIRNEESLLLETSLSVEDDDSVVAGFANFDRDFSRGKGAEALHDLTLLEDRYLTGRSA